MDQVRRFFEDTEEVFQKCIKWNMMYSLLISAFVGLAIAFLFKPCMEKWLASCPQGAENPKAQWGVAALACALSWFVIHYGCNWWYCRTRIEAGRHFSELCLYERLGRKIGPLTFFLGNTNFDLVLDHFGRDGPAGSKLLLRQVVQEQLNRAYAGNAVQIPVPNYAEFSSVLANLLDYAEDVCFTCIWAPKEWFMQLNSDAIVHRDLPKDFCPRDWKNGHDPRNQMQGLGIAESRAGKYPAHYLEFLVRRRSSSVRRRVFLLNEQQWESLISAQNLPFLDVFMGPCEKASVTTQFVDLKKLREQHAYLKHPHRERVESALERNIARRDYTVFADKAFPPLNAVMVYRDGCEGEGARPCEAGGAAVMPRRKMAALEFQTGDQANLYSDFLDTLFSAGLCAEHGVFSVSEVRNLINAANAPAARATNVESREEQTPIAETQKDSAPGCADE